MKAPPPKNIHKVMEQTAAQSAQQQRENKIAELEQKYGIAPTPAEQPGGDQLPTAPGEPQPQISREEYEVIKSVFERLGCDSLITYSDFFGNFIGYSFSRFFRTQPAVVKFLTELSNALPCNTKAIASAFVDSLEKVNETLYTLTENNPILEEASKLCDALDEAQYAYTRKQNQPISL